MSVEVSAVGMRVTLDLPWDEARARVESALGEKGFGILTEIDVRATLKKKLDADFRRYVILGACNPPLAQRALTAELEIGLLLPCNVVLWEEDDGRVVVSAIEPRAMLTMVPNEALSPVAEEVRERLLGALETLAS